MRASAVWRRGAGRLVLLCALCLAAGAPARAAASRTITDIRVRDQRIVIVAAEAGELNLQSFVLDDPVRLVFDIADAALAPGLSGSQVMDALGLGQLRIGRRAEGGVRLVVDLQEGAAPPGWQIEPGRNPAETLIVFEAAQPVRLGSPTVGKQEGRWVVRLPGAAHARRRLDALDDPPRVFVDVATAVLPAQYRQAFTDSPLREVRTAAHGSEEQPAVRLVVELAEPQSYTAQLDGDDLVLSFGEPSAAASARAAEEGTLRRDAKEGVQGKVIVIDPGHGGAKPGAIYGDGRDEVMEKGITLDIGLRLAALLQEAGATVRMTRKDDTDIGLTERADLANDLKADAFISIHVNSCATPDTLHGTSVYYDHQNSARLARLVQEELIAALSTRDNNIRSANFSVIRRVQCPGILVETAFINHAEDRKLLTDPTSRQKMARAILNGVARFFLASPAAGPPKE